MFKSTAKALGELKNVKTVALLAKERKYSPKNYTPMPVVFSKAKGTRVWDVDGNEYIDFNSSYSATNQGHSHPKIVEAMIKQSENLIMPSRAFTHDLYGEFSEFVCDYFGYEKFVPMNGGAEAIEVVIKLARAWGYTQKGIEPHAAKVLTVLGCYHGRTTGATSLSSDEYLRKNYGPYTPGLGATYADGTKTLHYNNIEELEDAFKTDGDKIACLLMESIQGEGGIFVYDPGYLVKVKELCKKYNVLWAADEIQSGCGRTGKLLACDHDGVRPDILVVAKSISGGVYPTSLVLSSEKIYSSMAPNTHGATFSGSPLSCATTIAALKVLKDEKMIENSADMGDNYLLPGLRKLMLKHPKVVSDVRGKGLFTAFDIDYSGIPEGRKAWHLCMLLKSRGILAKTVHDNVIRFAPQLIITQEEIEFALNALDESLKDLANPDLEIPEAELFESYYCY